MNEQSVSLQLHAEPGELVRLAQTWSHTHDLVLAAEQFFPRHRAFEVEPDEGGGIESLQVDRLALRRGRFSLDVASAAEFAAKNPGTLFIILERVVDNQLGESAIGGVTSDDGQAATWRRMLRLVREQAHKGAEVRSRHTTDVLRRPSHRHTVGAHELALQGVRMVAFRGGNEYVFDDLSDQPVK